MAIQHTLSQLTGALVVAAVVLIASGTRAQAPAQIPVQGFLADDDGTPLDGDQTLRFDFYSVDVGGAVLFTETQTVSVQDGFFTAYLGDTATLDLSLFRDNPLLFVEVSVGAETLSPRLQMASTPYAAYAEHAGEVPFSGLTGVPSGLADGDDDTTYSAGTGLDLTGTTFSVDDATFQRRVSAACPAGEMISAIAQDGSPTCVRPPDPDPSEFQRRVSATCPAGSSIRAIAENGTVTCELDDDSGGDITSVSGSGGITASGCSSGTCSLSFDATAVFTSDPVRIVRDNDTNVSLGTTGTLTSITVTGGVHSGEVALIALADLDCQTSGCVVVAGSMGWGTSSGDTTLEGTSSTTTSSTGARGSDTLYSLATYAIPAGSTRTYYLRGLCNGGTDTCSYEDIQVMAIYVPD